MNCKYTGDMTMDEYVIQITEQIKLAKDNTEVEKVIQVSIANMTEREKSRFVLQQYLDKLRVAIEDISPLKCSSDQWSCYRFALICIMDASVMHITEDVKKIS